jgi:hypothetical protein
MLVVVDAVVAVTAGNKIAHLDARVQSIPAVKLVPALTRGQSQ